MRQMKAVLIASAVFTFAAISGASAHPKLVNAQPAVDGTVKAAPSEITLRFNERLEGSFSKVVIKNSEGKQVDKGDAKVDRSDRRILRVSVPTLPAGQYKVEWQAMSADTHKVEGDFAFRVGP
jgi:copper resistance protein C